MTANEKIRLIGALHVYFCKKTARYNEEYGAGDTHVGDDVASLFGCIATNNTCQFKDYHSIYYLIEEMPKKLRKNAEQFWVLMQ